ncbi:MAG: response regulator [Candidatus Hydrogenedentales bacterium]|jgi:CheY-like chemotaxis protein
MALILIADDDSASFDVLAVALTAEGHKVLYAADGQEALELAVEAQPDLIFLDVMMPVFDGYETCERLRNDPNMPEKLPIIFLTATDEDPRRIQEVGGSDYLTKRHMIAELQDMLVKHLGPNAFGD